MCNNEISIGTILTTAAVLGIGTAIDLAALVGVAVVEINTITVFNDSDRPVKVEFINTRTARVEYFYVPDGGKSYTHRLISGSIAYNSLRVHSTSGNTPASGNITVNLCNS